MFLSPASRVVILTVLYLVFVALACSSGYLKARHLPVRFWGEKVLIGLLLGMFFALLAYGSQRLIGGQVRPLRVALVGGFFLLQGTAIEITLYVRTKRKRQGIRYNNGP